jgi:heme exporter protein C
MFGTVGVALGAIWGKPTWGVYWTWDPRLTTAAIMLVAYMGYLALRRFVEDPEKRAVWSAVVGIIAAVDLPIIWFSVKWWRSLHQVQSSPKTVDPAMVEPLRISAFAFLAFMILFIIHRYRIAMHERQSEVALPEALPTDGASANRTAGVV